jgi:hypothetical protein
MDGMTEVTGAFRECEGSYELLVKVLKYSITQGTFASSTSFAFTMGCFFNSVQEEVILARCQASAAV